MNSMSIALINDASYELDHNSSPELIKVAAMSMLKSRNEKNMPTATVSTVATYHRRQWNSC